MYYCIKCKEFHEEATAEKVFTTGFHTAEGVQTSPLGLCKTEQSKVKIIA